MVKTPAVSVGIISFSFPLTRWCSIVNEKSDLFERVVGARRSGRTTTNAMRAVFGPIGFFASSIWLTNQHTVRRLARATSEDLRAEGLGGGRANLRRGQAPA